MRRVVITKVGVVSSIGSGLDEFSEALFAGKSGARLLPDLFGANLAGIPVPFGAPVGNFVDDRNTPGDSRMHRSEGFALSALSQLDGESCKGFSNASLNCGVGIGQLFPDEKELSQNPSAWLNALLERQRDPRVEVLGARQSCLFADYGAIRMQRAMGLNNIVQTFVSACAAGTQACIQACEEIRMGASVAIGGAHDSLLSVAGIYLMNALGTLSTNYEDCTKAVRPFDRDRDGTMLGEGAAYFLFEERQYAIERGAEILCEIVGYGTSLDGYHITNPDPSGKGGVRMIRNALAMAGISSDKIDYINAHGTATVVNDPIETNIINRVMLDHRPFVSSTKPQIGHLIAASGAVELVACIAALREQRVPPNCNLEDPDPECDLRYPDPDRPEAEIEYVLCNSFGFAGQNACIILRRHSDN